ncbi:HNH endonuclease [Gordonia sp. HY002]|uniref:HNH endonuclease n=1 Tax=Gordonia zhenghanii TaxID=2911516 RepID=UPI001EF127D7|nr:HNH endonuclease signature motif containing protein [Gordonia zhenghanii]MCF8570461.1 HNH endonuclease [Gordonia zhenghanii]MCF8602582.1 HNH endonuclease [Gordonia zhenghanii]
MTAWIVTISRDYPDHWDYAVEREFWDITNAKDIRAGDDVFFWQSGQSFVGWTRVTQDAVPIEETMPEAPWNDRPYKRRFSFELVSDDLRTDIRWGKMAAATGVRELPSNGQVSVPSGSEQFLRDLFNGSTLPPGGDGDGYPDTRKKVTALIHRRQGQPQFRQKLLVAYRNKCAITGSSVTEILEAAHIQPYRGEHSHQTNNGILMRSDLHTLFDLHLITLEFSTDSSQILVRVSEPMRGTEYDQYDSHALSLPSARQDWPAQANLKAHHDDCAWFSSATRGPQPE